MTVATETVSDRLQGKRNIGLVRVWDAMIKGARHYVNDNGFVGVHSMPEIVGVTGACENVDTLFKVDFFGRQAYLAQSDQLYLELMTPSLGKVYTEIQSFRAEPEADDRHLCQFSLFEIEHLGDLEQLQRHVTGVVCSALDYALEHHRSDLTYEIGVSQDWTHDVWVTARDGLKNGVFPSKTYTWAVEYLQENGFPELQWGDDLKADHEAALTEHLGATFITHYPKPIKFFNMRESDIHPGVVNSCDLLLPKAGESAGAAERETRYEHLERRLKSSDMYKRLIELGGNDEDFEWYLAAHRGKDVPLHSGAGIGMARVAQYLIGQDDIRMAVPFVVNSECLL